MSSPCEAPSQITKGGRTSKNWAYDVYLVGVSSTAGLRGHPYIGFNPQHQPGSHGAKLECSYDGIRAATAVESTYTAGQSEAEVPDAQLFRSGEEYVVFLHWNPVFGGFEVKNGNYGAFKLANGTVAVPSHSDLAKSVTGQDQSTFLSTLRALGASSR